MLQTGHYSKIYKTNKKNVVKKIKNNTRSCHERDILRYLSEFSELNIYVVKYLDDFEDDEYIYIIMEYLEGLNLKDILYKNFEDDYNFYNLIFKHLLLGLSYIHKQGVIHRDIKPTNIVMSSGYPKYIDFGLSMFINELSINEQMGGTWYYISPELSKIVCYKRGFFKKLNDNIEVEEIIKNINTPKKYEELYIKSDIWSLGVCFYQLVTKSLPFNGENHEKMLWDIYHKSIEVNIKCLKFKILIEKMLIKDYTNRPSIEELLTIL